MEYYQQLNYSDSYFGNRFQNVYPKGILVQPVKRRNTEKAPVPLILIPVS